jgi:hypothetical protein
LLWISSVEERGKTMMAIHLSQKLEKAAERNNSTILYFFVDRQDKKDTAVHILRGLLTRMTKINGELAKHLLEEYEVQKEALFSKDSIEPLWHVFKKMVTDSSSGQIYCIIDGLNYCTDEFLRRLMSRILDFYSDESPSNAGASLNQDQQCPYPVSPGGERKLSGKQRGASLKMILVSRESPEWMVAQLSNFPHIDIGVPTKKHGSVTGTVSRAARRPPTLASVAISVMHKQRLERSRKENDVVAPKHSSENAHYTANATLSMPWNDNTASSSVSNYLSSSNANSWDFLDPLAVMTTQTREHSLATSIPLYQSHESDGSPSLMAIDSPTSIKPDGSVGALRTPSSSRLPIELEACPQQALKSQSASETPPPLPPRHIIQTLGYGQYSTELQAEEEPFEMYLEEDYSDPALRLYVESKIADSDAIQQFPTDVQSYIVSVLEYRGDGTFLWVDFAIQEVEKRDLAHLETVLNTLPATMTEMYGYILNNIAPDLTGLVAGLLRWAVYARRPLDMAELAVAVNLTQYSVERAESVVRSAVRACGNMLTISEEDQTINVVHSSLVDFLCDESSPIRGNPRLAQFIIRTTRADNEIANFCIAYLEAGCCNRSLVSLAGNPVALEISFEQYPFMPYAVEFWPHHLRDAQNPYLNLSSPFFEPKS